MADLRIEEYNVGDIGTNCYFIVNADTKEMVIIDPGGDGADLIRRIKERGLKLQAVLLTHGHYDHAHHARMVADAFGVPVYASEKEEATMHDIQKNVSAMFGNPETYDADVYAKDGDVLDLAGFKIKVISTPGIPRVDVAIILMEIKCWQAEIRCFVAPSAERISKVAACRNWCVP